MGKILILTTYYNNPNFIKLQRESFYEFIEDEWEFIVIDDSEPNVMSLASGEPIGNDIKAECDRLGLKCVKVPKSVHKSKSEGGLVPDGLPANHPTERHRACLHFILSNLSTLESEKYDLILLTESDVFIKKHINFHDYMGDHDLLGTGRSTMVHRTDDPNQVWVEEIEHLKQVWINFFTMYLLLINPKKVKNIEQMDIGGFGGTDTGGKTSFYLDKNPQLKWGFLEIGHNKDDQIDVFSKEKGVDELGSEFIHYRGGSNWDYQSIDYYNEKLNRMLKKYVPELYNNQPTHLKTLTSRDGEHTFNKD